MTATSDATPSRPQAIPEAARRAGLKALNDWVAGEVVTALRASDLPVLLLKGPSVARWLYDDPADRNYGDIDLLVSPSSLTGAEEVLRTIGFDPPPSELPTNPAKVAREWRRPSDGVEIDLHVTFQGIGADPDGAWSVLSEDPDSMDIGGRKVPVPSVPTRLLLVALHAANTGRRGTQALEDLDRAATRMPLTVWKKSVDLAIALDAMPAMIAGLVLLPVGRKVVAELGLDPGIVSVEAAIKMGSPPHVDRNFAIAIERLRQTPDLGARLAFVRGKLFPPRVWMIQRSSLANRGQLGLALAYMQRLAWLGARFAPGLRTWVRARRRVRDLRSAGEE